MTDVAGDLRAATGDALVRLVLEAPPDGLRAAFDNPAFEEEHLLLMLRRPDLGSELLTKVAETPRWISSYMVKSAVVAHPQTPKVIAVGFAKHLFWRDLAKLVSNLKTRPAVRRTAELLLRDRLHEISPGERSALARIAPREVIGALRAETDERVVAALLENPRLTEEDVAAIASSRKTSAGLLGLIARTDRWAVRSTVRAAIVRNPRTPYPLAIGLLPGLADSELRATFERPEVPAGIRSAARRLHAGRRTRGGA